MNEDLMMANAYEAYVLTAENAFCIPETMWRGTLINTNPAVPARAVCEADRIRENCERPFSKMRALLFFALPANVEPLSFKFPIVLRVDVKRALRKLDAASLD